MGVLGLWQLLAPVGQPVTLESLENKIFAVDISIWLNQAVKGYRDSQGGSVPNAHLHSLFSRLCKLLFYKIRPIIVFDGGFPELKKQTIINRQQRRAALKQNSRDVGLKLLTNYIASQQLAESASTSKCDKVVFKPKEKPRDELFKLPPLPENSNCLSDTLEDNEDYEGKFTNFSREDIKYLNQIDIESDDFNNLPPDVKQEILSTLKESRKYRSWDFFNELPRESNEFSSYQMQNLLKKRKLQSKLEEVQKTVRQINSSAYVSQYTNDHVIGETNKIMSDDSSYYVLLKKIIDKKVKTSEENSAKPSSSVMADTKSAFIRDIEVLEYENESPSDSLSQVVKTEYEEDIAHIKMENKSLDLSDEEYAIDNPLPTNEGSNKDLTLAKSFNKSASSKLSKFDTKNVKSVLNNENVPGDLLKSDCKISECEKILPKSLTTVIAAKNEIQTDVLKDLASDPEMSIISQKQIFSAGNEETVISSSSEDEMIPVPSTTEETHLKTSHLQKPISTFSNTETENNTVMCSTSKISEDTIPAEIFDSKSEINEIEFMSNSFDFENDIASSETAANTVVTNQIREVNKELQENLETAASIFQAEQAKQDRQAKTVQHHMIEESKELLQLFGIPYIVSPSEAEAQCAFFDLVELTHGTITDDSDVWLFGGKRVYKNFFTQQKFVEFYKDKEVFTHFGLSRRKLINFALLTGSDYTEGIEGVGPVTAMEIISEFPGEGIDALQKFKDWWEHSNKYIKSPENKIRAKLKKLVLPQNFPEEKVVEAYLNPEIDSSTEKFTWGRPDLDALREYARERFGWNQSKVDDALLPVIKKLNERDTQTHLDSFFTISLRKDVNLFPSKRIMSALKKITSPHKSGTEKQGTSLKRKSKPSGKKIRKKVATKSSLCTKSSSQIKSNFKTAGPVLSEESSDD